MPRLRQHNSRLENPASIYCYRKHPSSPLAKELNKIRKGVDKADRKTSTYPSFFQTMKSYLAKPGEIERTWHVVDATDKVLGKLAVKVSNILRGRHKPTYTPHVDTGDFVIIINANKVVLTGKKEEQKTYMFYSGWMGNEKYRKVEDMRKKRPTFIIEHAVKGMLPKNRLARQMLKKLKIFPGPEHTHEAQKPIPLSI